MSADTMRAAMVLNHLRGGHESWQAERHAAADLAAPPSRAREMIRRYDLFQSRCAEAAVLGGMTAVVFGSSGFPFGHAPHQAAAQASPDARFIYADPSAVVADLRARSITDGRAVAIRGTVAEPAALLRAAGLLGDGPRWLGTGPCQVQWGLGAGSMTAGEAVAALAAYRRLLPSRSQVVIAVPDGDGGRRLAAAAGLIAHAPADVAAWCDSCGLVNDGVTDVRAWGRPVLGEELRGGGRIMAAVAVVP
jgi:hypothetical protein